MLLQLACGETWGKLDRLTFIFSGGRRLKFLLDDIVQLARPKEVLQHHWSQFVQQYAHEAQKAGTDALKLVLDQVIVELELLVRSEEADLRDDEEL